MTNTIIDNINKHLELRGVKQIWIAEMIEMKPMVLSNILNKKSKKIDIDILDKIANALHVSLQELSDPDYINKLESELFYKEETDSCLEFYTNALNEKDATIIENIISVMDVIAVFKQANEELSDDEKDYLLTKKRLKTFDQSKSISREEMMKKSGITQQDLDSISDENIEFE